MNWRKKYNTYPPELWEYSGAPEWSGEHVWQQIENLQKQSGSDLSKWLILLLISLCFLVQSEERLKLDTIPSQEIIRSESKIIEFVPQAMTVPEQQETKLSGESPQTAKVKSKPASSQHNRKSTAQASTAEDLAPVAGQTAEIPAVIAVLPVEKTSALLLEDRTRTLPAGIRKGSKFVLRVPEILPTDARQGAFTKRLWQQFKQFNTKGTVDWVELGIQPNGDGTFSLLPPARSTESPN